MTRRLTDEELESIEESLREAQWEIHQRPGLPGALMGTVERLLTEIRFLRAENAELKGRAHGRLPLCKCDCPDCRAIHTDPPEPGIRGQQ